MDIFGVLNVKVTEVVIPEIRDLINCNPIFFCFETFIHHFDCLVEVIENPVINRASNKGLFGFEILRQKFPNKFVRVPNFVTEFSVSDNNLHVQINVFVFFDVG